MNASPVPTIAIVTESPRHRLRLLPIAQSIWPKHHIATITTTRIGRYQFDYPSDLSYARLPFLGEPAWKPRNFAIGLERSIDMLSDDSLTLAKADEVIFAADPDPAGVIGFHVLLSQSLGHDFANQERKALMLHDLSEASIEQAFRNPSSTRSEWFVRALHAGTARRYFDFNYNINAIVLFGAALRAAGAKTDTPFGVSKYALQLLYYVRTLAAPPREEKLLGAMQAWHGTGKYTASMLGSPSSFTAIIENLKHHRLLERQRSSRIAITDIGHQFLSKLHRDCEDMDLPHRIRLWEQDWPNSKVTMQRYLRTFFVKQSRISWH